jgi:alkylated DNA repair dioxygenase AlkB
MRQRDLFDASESEPQSADRQPRRIAARLPSGFEYRDAFLAPSEEAELIAIAQALPLQHATYKGYTARRRTVSFAAQYDFDDNTLLPAAPIPESLWPLRDRACTWAGIDAAEVAHALVAQYPPGAPLGWHRDVPQFRDIIGISLGSACRMRLRRYPPVGGRDPDAIVLTLQPRSICDPRRGSLALATRDLADAIAALLDHVPNAVASRRLIAGCSGSPTVSPSARAASFRCDTRPLSQASRASPIRALT